QWVVWRWEWREDKPGKGKWTKNLYTPATGRQAKVDTPETWGDFASALVAYQDGSCAGIGFVLTEDDPYCGADFDKCRDPDTEEIDLWAEKEWIGLGGYGEVSPTGTGIKAIVCARKPGAKCKASFETGEVEIYASGRFFALTGQALPGSTTDV